MIRLSQGLPGHARRAGKPAFFGTIALTAVLAVAGCGASSSGSSGSSSGSSTTQSSAFRKCLEQHGVTPPAGGHFPGGGGGGGSSTASPHPRPTGSRSSSFQQAIQACGGSGGFGHGGQAG